MVIEVRIGVTKWLGHRDFDRLCRTNQTTSMAVHLKPETESRLHQLASQTGRTPEDLIEDAMAGHISELSQVRNLLDTRYDEIKSGKVKAIDGEEAFARLHQRSKARRSS